MTQRFAMAVRLKDEKREFYIKNHAEVWPEVLNELKQVGAKFKRINSNNLVKKVSKYLKNGKEKYSSRKFQRSHYIYGKIYFRN